MRLTAVVVGAVLLAALSVVFVSELLSPSSASSSLPSSVAALDARLLALQLQLLHGARPWLDTAPRDSKQAACRDTESGGGGSAAVLPLFVVVVGLEGAGHDALAGAWEALQMFYSVGVLPWDGRRHGHLQFGGYAHTTISLAYHKRMLRALLRTRHGRGQQLIVDPRTSYPSGFAAGSLAHVDLLHLLRMDGELLRLRVLVLARAPAQAVAAAAHRFAYGDRGFKHFRYQARAAQQLSVLLNNQLRLLPCRTLLSLALEDLAAHPAQTLATLAEFLGVAPHHLQLGASKDGALPLDVDERRVRPEAFRELHAFFALQARLWPTLAQSPTLYRLASNSSAVIPYRDDEHQILDDLPDEEVRYLKLGKSPMHLGFNNVLFVLRIGSYLARMLGRQLAFSATLRIRHCDDEALCAASGCEQSGIEYLCPLELFLDSAALRELGVYLYEKEGSLLSTLGTLHDNTAFEELYAAGAVALDHVPRNGRGEPLRRFPYYTAQFNCECLLTGVSQAWWTGPVFLPGKNVTTHLVDFGERYGGVQEPVLVLHGEPHRIGRLPTAWASEAGLQRALAGWTRVNLYNRAVESYGRLLAGLILGERRARSFVCLHLRRDDFSDLGWNARAQNISVVAGRLRQLLQPGEALYVATDEADLATLQPLLALGASFYANYSAALRATMPDRALLGFKDYVGVVEQQACSLARAFVGSMCSSYSGSIVAQRRQRDGWSPRMQEAP